MKTQQKLTHHIYECFQSLSFPFLNSQHTKYKTSPLKERISSKRGVLNI